MLTKRLAVAALLLGASLVANRANAVEAAPIAVGEIAPPSADTGMDAAGIRDAAEGEIRQIDPAAMPSRGRRFVVSLSLMRAAVDGPVRCKAAAMVRDAKTGTMIAIIEGLAHADGPASAEVRRQVAESAVRSAVRRIPAAIAAR